MNVEQPPLFELPDDAPHPRRNASARPGVRYQQYRPKVRTLCDDCIAVIHALGVARAPLPRAVRWRRSSADGVLHLCEPHKNDRMETEA